METLKKALAEAEERAAKEKAARERLFVMPEQEKNENKIKQTLRWSRSTIWVGIVVTAMMIVLWVIPYYQGIRG